MGCYV